MCIYIYIYIHTHIHIYIYTHIHIAAAKVVTLTLAVVGPIYAYAQMAACQNKVKVKGFCFYECCERDPDLETIAFRNYKTHVKHMIVPSVCLLSDLRVWVSWIVRIIWGLPHAMDIPYLASSHVLHVLFGLDTACERALHTPWSQPGCWPYDMIPYACMDAYVCT